MFEHLQIKQSKTSIGYILKAKALGLNCQTKENCISFMAQQVLNCQTKEYFIVVFDWSQILCFTKSDVEYDTKVIFGLSSAHMRSHQNVFHVNGIVQHANLISD